VDLGIKGGSFVPSTRTGSAALLVVFRPRRRSRTRGLEGADQRGEPSSAPFIKRTDVRTLAKGRSTGLSVGASTCGAVVLWSRVTPVVLWSRVASLLGTPARTVCLTGVVRRSKSGLRSRKRIQTTPLLSSTTVASRKLRATSRSW